MVHSVQRVALHLLQMRGVDVKASQSAHNALTRGSVDWSCNGVGRCVVGGSGEVGESSVVSSVAVVSSPLGRLHFVGEVPLSSQWPVSPPGRFRCVPGSPGEVGLSVPEGGPVLIMVAGACQASPH